MKNLFFDNATIQKLKEILTSSLRHLKAQGIFININTHRYLSTLMPNPEIKSLKHTHMGTKNNKGLKLKSFDLNAFIDIHNDYTHMLLLKMKTNFYFG